jgi:3-hydroxymyristoyl/3-hydroxydecanoyl-(acyl carrier protein) dehydratase
VTSGEERESGFTVDAGHPSLAGHFPGEPVLPGVVVLDRVIEAAQEWLGPGLAVVGLPQAKFMAPLRPGDAARISLRRAGDKLHFRVVCGERLAATGLIEFRCGQGGT